ncbi:MAG: hypothetical protein ONB55_01830 [candidate division KSB1 bacterium]|nr:hypothetical protein [candidate division KSB1 bacterium]
MEFFQLYNDGASNTSVTCAAARVSLLADKMSALGSACYGGITRQRPPARPSCVAGNRHGRGVLFKASCRFRRTSRNQPLTAFSNTPNANCGMSMMLQADASLEAASPNLFLVKVDGRGQPVNGVEAVEVGLTGEVVSTCCYDGNARLCFGGRYFGAAKHRE